MHCLENETNRLFVEFSTPKDLNPPNKRHSPLTDLQETEDTLIIHESLPGIKKEELTIEAAAEEVEIHAETKGERENARDKMHYKERYAQKYAPSIRFSVAVKPKAR
ncbi:MAG: Hsp20/alpha crystallin family protein [Candidatus Hodarchaeota archaeon]